MDLSKDIELLSTIKVKILPKEIYGIDPKVLIKKTIQLLTDIDGFNELPQEKLNELIQIHQDTDVLTEQLSGSKKIEIDKVYKITLKILRATVLHKSDKVEQIISDLETTFNHENASFRITEHEYQEIRGNADGLRDFAVQLLKTSIGKPTELNEDWFENDDESYPVIVTLNYYDKTKNIHEYQESWKDKLAKLGCVLVGIFLLASLLIGFIGIYEWIIK